LEPPTLLEILAIFKPTELLMLQLDNGRVYDDNELAARENNTPPISKQGFLNTNLLKQYFWGIFALKLLFSAPKDLNYLGS
jgi:hypothetical protein